MKIAVVGAGVIGTTAAYRLAMAGCDVDLIDSSGKIPTTSEHSFAWLGAFPQASGRQTLSEHDLEMQSELKIPHRLDEDITELQADLDQKFLHWTGSLRWTNDQSINSELHKACKEVGQTNIKVHEIDAPRASEIEPELRLEPEASVYWEPSAGWVDAPKMISAITRKLEEVANIRRSTVVTQVSRSGAKVNLKADVGTTSSYDSVVLATGANTSLIAATAGLAIPMHQYPGLMVYATTRSGRKLKTIIHSPDVSVRPHGAQRVAIHMIGDKSMDTARPNAKTPEEVLAAAQKRLPDLLKESRIVATAIGVRPVPPDGPIMGWAPGYEGKLYIATSHGGVRWSATWAKMITTEIVHHKSISELAKMRPSRFSI